MKLKDLTCNKGILNAFWLISGRLSNKVLAFIVGIVTARYLGPSNFGLINYAAAYIGFFTSLCTLGLNSVLVNHLVREFDAEGEIMGTSLFMRLLSSILSIVSIAVIVCIMDSGEKLTITVVVLSSFALLFQTFDTINYWFQSKLLSKYYAIVSLLAYTVMSIYKIMLLFMGKSVQWFAVATALEYAVAALLLLLVYRRNNGPHFSVSLERAKMLLKSSSSFIISGIMVAVYGYTDKLMLKQMLDADAVAYYSLAISFSTTWVFILSAIIESIHPSVVKACQENNERYLKRNRQLYAIVFWMSMFVSVIISLLAKFLIVILYGTEYMGAITPLRVVVWYTAFSYLGVARNIWIVCENKQRYIVPIYVLSALSNVALNYLLIPTWGSTGAACASLLTQICTILFWPWMIPALRPNVKLMLEAMKLKDVFPKKKESDYS